jgi:hypothetical protein
MTIAWCAKDTGLVAVSGSNCDQRHCFKSDDNDAIRSHRAAETENRRLQLDRMPDVPLMPALRKAIWRCLCPLRVECTGKPLLCTFPHDVARAIYCGSSTRAIPANLLDRSTLRSSDAMARQIADHGPLDWSVRSPPEFVSRLPPRSHGRGPVSRGQIEFPPPIHLPPFRALRLLEDQPAAASWCTLFRFSAQRVNLDGAQPALKGKFSTLGRVGENEPAKGRGGIR